MGWLVNAMLYPPGKPGTHCKGGWVGLRGDLDRCRKSRPPLGFDSWTIQPVVSRYTDYRIQRFNGKPFITHIHSICNAVTQSAY
jgi:hypothetical protein